MSNQNPNVAGRPLWKRLGGRLRWGWHRTLTVVDRACGSSDPLLPPAHLRFYYYRSRDAAPFLRARDAVRTEVLSHGLRPGDRVLDIGSGIGNLALSLVDFLEGTYDGVEIHPAAVAWCQQAIASRFPRVRFHHADIFSSAYNPAGRLAATAYHFPFEDGRFDFVFLGSVFTHMLPEDVAHYLVEIGRVLKPGGTCAASFFLLNDRRRDAVIAARSFMPFPFQDETRRARFHDIQRPEAAIALEEDFVAEAYAAAALDIRAIRRGDWWNGRADDQDVVTAVSRA